MSRTALKSGYNSHYVIVNPSGTVPPTAEIQNPTGPLYDEVVIPQESQIVPVYVIRLDTKKDPFKKKKSRKDKSRFSGFGSGLFSSGSTSSGFSLV